VLAREPTLRRSCADFVLLLLVVVVVVVVVVVAVDVDDCGGCLAR